MDIRLLRYFLTVAREETISGAAKVLHLTQPTLSRQMMELEKGVGSTLFIRGNRKITLTEEGMLLRKRAQEIIDLVDKTESELTIPDANISGNIYIGGGETHGMRLIADVIQELHEKYPKVKFHLYSGNADDVTERLDKGLLDFGILIGPANLGKYESLQLPVDDVWGVLMRNDSPLANHKTIHSKDLWDVPLIASRQRLVSDEISDWIKKQYEELNVVATYNLVYNASLLVEKGIGYALCLDKLVNVSGESELCFRPLEPRLETNLNIVWKKNQVFPKAAETFLNVLQKSFSTKL